MSKFLEWLKGKRTVFVQLGAIFAAIGAYLTGELSLMEMGGALWAALTAIYAALKVNRLIESNGG